MDETSMFKGLESDSMKSMEYYIYFLHHIIITYILLN